MGDGVSMQVSCAKLREWKGLALLIDGRDFIQAADEKRVQQEQKEDGQEREQEYFSGYCHGTAPFSWGFPYHIMT